MSETKQLTFKWVQNEDKVIKFSDDVNFYDASDKVNITSEAYEKLGIVPGTKVSVVIDGNTVLSVTKIGNEAVKTEEKVQNPELSDNTKNILTIDSFKKEYRGLIFKEQEDQWYTLAKNIDWDSVGIAKGVQVEFTDKDPEGKSKNRIITSIKVLEVKQEQKETPVSEPKSKAKNDYSNNVQVSIEAQAAVNSANRIVSSLVDNGTTPEEILKMITRIANHNYDLIQKLKNQ